MSFNSLFFDQIRETEKRKSTFSNYNGYLDGIRDKLKELYF